MLASRVTEEGNNWAICGGRGGGLRMAFMIVAVGGKSVCSEGRGLRLCAWFGRKGTMSQSVTREPCDWCEMGRVESVPGVTGQGQLPTLQNQLPLMGGNKCLVNNLEDERRQRVG